MTDALTPIQIDLAGAIVAVRGDTPQILLARQGGASEGAEGAVAEDALPSGPFNPLEHRTFELGLRAWVTAQAGLALGYVEQLYTFGDRGRHAQPGDVSHMVSVGYLALTRALPDSAALPGSAAFRSWYRFFPWEDWRQGRPAVLDRMILPRLAAFAADSDAERRERPRQAPSRKDRVRLCFGIEGAPWDEEKTLDRYELLYEAGLVSEAWRDGRMEGAPGPFVPGEAMRLDHRRILATAIGRLRAKLKYRPVVFELLPGEFTLTELQRTAEAISGRHLHKQNFRRFVESTGLVEATGTTTRTGGRPAALFRYRRDVVQERPSPGLRVSARG